MVWYAICNVVLSEAEKPLARTETKMLRMQFYELPNGTKMQLEGRFVREFAEHARTLIGRSVVPSNLVVDLSEVSFVDGVGEEVLLWVKGIGAKFAAESAYARHVCECLQLPIDGDRSAGSQHVRHRARRRAPGCEPSKEQAHVPLQGETQL